MLDPKEILKLTQDWISIIFLLFFLLIALLRNQDKKRFDMLILFFSSEKYFRIYGKEKKTNYLNPFDLSLIFIVLIVKSLLFFFVFDKILKYPSSYKTFQNIFLILMTIISIRHYFFKYVFIYLNLYDVYSETVFKSISSYFRISILSSSLLLLYQYTFLANSTFLFTCLLLVIVLTLYTHLKIYLKIVNHTPSNIFYIILYLCAFKITPWLWLYSSGTFNF